MNKTVKRVTVNRIRDIHLEIDYDKLAESIVKAEKKAKENTPLKELPGFWKKVGHIIINKKGSQRAYMAYLMASILSTVLNILAIACLLFFVVLWVICIDNFLKGIATAESISVFVVSMGLPLMALTFRACANEMSQEENRDYIVAAFSAIVGLAALIISVVALVK